jgi:electron transport complex protein RnfE
MFGAGTEWLTITLIEDYRGFLLAILPPGAFLCLGLLIAIKNLIDDRLARRASLAASNLPTPKMETSS